MQDYIDDGRLHERADGTRNPLQTLPLLDAIAADRFDAVFGGARRDEDKARAKERIIACATSSASGTRATSAPSCGTSTTAGTRSGEHVRAFPISNWTELDVWRYIEREGIALPAALLRPRARGVRARRHVASPSARSRRRAPTRPSRPAACATARSAT